jgi:hypothetical protein
MVMVQPAVSFVEWLRRAEQPEGGAAKRRSC